MIGFGVGAEGSYQKNLVMGFVIAIAFHLIFGFFIDDLLKVNSAVENESSQKQFNVELIKLNDKTEKINNKPLYKDSDDEDSFSNEIMESKTPRPEPTISIQPSKAWIETEIRTHLKVNPDAIEKFKQSFIINQNNDSEPTTYLRESGDGVVSVKKKLFGKDVCYSFDANDDAFGTFAFHPCKEKPKFNFKMK